MAKYLLEFFFLPAIFLPLKLSPNVSNLINIIPFVFETSNAIDNVRYINDFIFCFPSVTNGLELIIFLVLKFALGLDSVGSGFCLGSSVYLIMNNLSIDICLDKRSLVTISSLALGNAAALLICLSKWNDIPTAKSYVLNPIVSGLSYIACIA